MGGLFLVFEIKCQKPHNIPNIILEINAEYLDCNLGNAYPRQPASSFKGPLIKDINKSKRNIGNV